MLSHSDYKKRRRSAAVSAAGLFLIGALFGAYIMIEVPVDFNSLFGLGNAVREEPVQTPETVGAGTPREVLVAENAETDWIVRFGACGHEVALDPPGSVAGMTRKELAIAYPDDTIEIFDAEYVRMAKSVDGYCPAHYLLTMGEGVLVISKMDLATLAQKEVMRIIADTSALDEDSLAALSKGVTFDSLEDINAYLEGAE